MPVITVARQYGSLGDEIARDVSERLGLRLVGQDIMSEVAQRLGIPEGRLTVGDERDSGMVSELVRTMRNLYPATIAPAQAEHAIDVDESALLQVMRQIIWEVARGNRAVIVGRGASFVLESNPEVLHVLLVASVQSRIERVMALENMTRQQAAQRVKSADASRARYIRHYYRTNWLDVAHYDLVLNSAHFSQRAATDLICAAAAPGIA
jgi:CMP/dCMP kinase